MAGAMLGVLLAAAPACASFALDGGKPLALEEARRLALDGDWSAASRLALSVAVANPGRPIAADAFALFLRSERRLPELLAGAEAVTLPALPGTPWLLAQVAQLYELAGFPEEAARWARQSWDGGGPPSMLLRSLRLRLEMGDASGVLAAIAEASAAERSGERADVPELRPVAAIAAFVAGRDAEARAAFEDVLALGTDASDRLAAAWGLYALARAGGDQAGEAAAAARLRALYPTAPEAAIVQPPGASGPVIVEAPTPLLLIGGAAAGSAAPPPSAAGGPSSAPAGTGYAVQVGSFRVRENADELAAELAKKGFQTSVRASAGETTLWRVYAGSRLSAEAAAVLADRLEAAGYSGLAVASP